MKPIGGFFELELPKPINNFPKNSLQFWCGRASLKFILSQLQISKLYLPAYICDSVLEPLVELNIEYEFYAIDTSFFPSDLLDLKEKEFFLYVNYFGICEENVNKLKTYYADKLILDNTQAFFSTIPNDIWCFNSLRKFFGVSDGSFLYYPTDFVCDTNNLYREKIENNIDYSHLINRLIGNQQVAYQEFQQSEFKFTTQLYQLSKLSESIFERINLNEVKQNRLSNFIFLHQHLGKYNFIKIDLDKIVGYKNNIPFSYPFYPKKEINRSELAKQNIFVPQLWKEVEQRDKKFKLEKEISKNILPLPIDQRYEREEMKFIVKIILSRL